MIYKVYWNICWKFCSYISMQDLFSPRLAWVSSISIVWCVPIWTGLLANFSRLWCITAFRNSIYFATTKCEPSDLFRWSSSLDVDCYLIFDLTLCNFQKGIIVLMVAVCLWRCINIINLWFCSSNWSKHDFKQHIQSRCFTIYCNSIDSRSAILMLDILSSACLYNRSDFQFLHIISALQDWICCLFLEESIAVW